MVHIYRTLRIHKSEVFLTKIGHVVAKKPKRPYFAVAQMHQSELIMSTDGQRKLIVNFLAGDGKKDDASKDRDHSD